MAVSFSSSSEEVISRRINVQSRSCSVDVDETFELDRCADWIKSREFERVALQFPDQLLPHSVDVVKRLERRIGSTKLYILADTSFGSCCIDEVAAEHANCQAVIHFGDSCLSAPSRLEALLVLGVHSVNWQPLLERIPELQAEKLLVVTSTRYSSHIDELRRLLPPTAVIGTPILPGQVIPSNCQKSLNRLFRTSDPLIEHTILWIGEEDRCQTNLIMNFNSAVIWSFSPESGKLQREGLSVSRSLMRRYYLVEKARDSRIIGILIGTLGVKNYLDAINHLRSLIKNSGRKSYTLAVGKLNVAKIANFQEIDIYVYVACPENTFFESKDFYRPVITPYELEVALNPNRQWGQGYFTDFNDILPGGPAHAPPPDPDSAPTYDTSLISGRIRTLGLDTATENTCDALVHKDGTMAVVHNDAAGEALSHRSWRGLNPEAGVAAATIKSGRSGLAMAYEEEGK